MTMESVATVAFLFSEADQEKWNALIDGLSQNKYGAYFEEYAEAFGEQAEELAEFVLDAWEQERETLDTSGSEIYSGKAIIHISGYEAVEEYTSSIAAFLKACGATNIKTNSDLDSDSC